MKRILFALLSLFVFASTNANEISVKPNSSLTAGTAGEVWFQIDFPSYTDAMISVTLNVQFPENWICGTSIANYSDGCKWDYDFDEQGTSSHFTGSAAKKSDGTYNILVYSSDTKPFKGNSGDVFSMKVKAPAGLADGYYPVIVSANSYSCKSTVDAENIVLERPQVSYIKVGNPTSPSIEIPAADVTTSAMQTFPADATVDFSNATAAYGTSSNAVNGTYTRTVSDTYASLYLPFDATVSGATAYEYKNTVDEKVYFEQATSLKKNTAYLVKMNEGAGSFTATGTSTFETKASTGMGFIGTCEPIAITTESGSGYGLSGDKFLPIGTKTTIPAFRAYLNTETSGAKSDLNIVFDDEATDITTTDLSVDDNDVVYGINGVRVNAKSAHNGVYVTKGKKVVIK